MEKSLYSREYEAMTQLLRELRVEQRLTQVELAERLNEPQPFVSRYEVGGRRLDFVEVWRICQALDIPFSEFVTRFEDAVSRKS